jgi:UDP-GlcNAc:undecaprenyl-phosphate GlcNAc-1-phosphate transferase
MVEAFAIAFLLSVCVIRVFMPLAVSFGFVDAPDLRKRHAGKIPLVGGVAIYATLVPLGLVLPFWEEGNGIGLLAIGLPLLLIGLADDYWQISARVRIGAEVCCSLAAIYFCDIRLDDIGPLIPGLGGTLVLLAIPLTVVSMVGVINAINMTDGVDGLAGGLALLTFSALALLAYPTNFDLALQLVSFVAVLLGFLYFNSRFFGRARALIFMGDGGAIFIGFALAWYLITLSQGPDAAYKPATALWLFAVPLLDTLTIMSRRIMHRQSPFAADREHLHHILLLAGFGANRTVLIILAAHLLCILCGLASIWLEAPDWVIFGLFAVLFAVYYAAMTRSWKVMKKIKLFREWAGFEDRRSEDRSTRGRRSAFERRQVQFVFATSERRTAGNRRSGKERA